MFTLVRFSRPLVVTLRYSHVNACVQYRRTSCLILHPVILRSAPLQEQKIDTFPWDFPAYYPACIRCDSQASSVRLRLDWTVSYRPELHRPPAPDLDTWVTWPANYHLIFLIFPKHNKHLNLEPVLEIFCSRHISTSDSNKDATNIFSLAKTMTNW